MGASSPTRRRGPLLAVGAALLATIVGLAWYASGSRETGSLLATDGLLGAENDVAPSRASLPDAPAPAATQSELRPLEGPRESARAPVEAAGKHDTLEVVVRTKADGLPIPNCEVLYIDADDDRGRVIEQSMQRHGLDLAELREITNRAMSDAEGHARLTTEGRAVHALAISPSALGLESFDLRTASSEEHTILCGAITSLRVQVVDTAGRPRAGIPLTLFPKQGGLFSFPVGATTRGAQGLAELLPIPVDSDGNRFVLAISGALPNSASLEIDSAALPAQPLQLVLPEHGTLEVRVLSPDGSKFTGSGEVTLQPRDPDAGLFENLPPQPLVLRSGRAVFQRVALGFQFDVQVRISGLEDALEAGGAGPRVDGETAVLEARLEYPAPTLLGRAFDSARRPLRFQRLRLRGTIQRDGDVEEFDSTCECDATGCFGMALDGYYDAQFQSAPTTLLIFTEEAAAPLGALRSLTLGNGPNELGSWTLQAPGLLASGHVREPNGDPAPAGTSVEWVEPEASIGLGWAATSSSDEIGRFELRGWTTTTTLTLLAGSQRTRERLPVEVNKGATDVQLVRPAPKPRKRK